MDLASYIMSEAGKSDVQICFECFLNDHSSCKT